MGGIDVNKSKIRTGKVILVGAGPGDEGLITVKGASVLRQAEVVVYDRLVGEGILEQIPEDAERIYVGKNAGHHAVPQERINEILLEKALEGKSVVRLKGGDGFVFGRGGEELERLRDHGIPFEVVPGITSAVAAPAYAGIPVTHRDLSASLHIITGHLKNDAALDLDYEALVRLGGTLVFMMSVSSIPEISKGLIQAGMLSETPCAAVENGTLNHQRKFVSTLSEMHHVVQAEKVQSPAVSIVGEVCQLSERFDWFSELPLKGRRILVTRPKSTSSKMSQRLKSLGAEVILAPVIRTKPVVFEVPDLSQFSVLIFTSAAGVNSFFDGLMARGIDVRGIFGKRIAVVGNETAAALKVFGLLADFIPSVYCGEALAREMTATGWLTTKDKALIAGASVMSPDLTDLLASKGIPFEITIVYETEKLPCQDIDPLAFDWITFTSASCVEGFVQCVAAEKLGAVRALCIGEQTAKEASKYSMQVTISKEATVESMIETICEEYEK
jgi:uroporphyrinogen III methyltransferase/synthase